MGNGSHKGSAVRSPVPLKDLVTFFHNYETHGSITKKKAKAILRTLADRLEIKTDDCYAVLEKLSEASLVPSHFKLGRDEFILLLFTAARKCRVELERDVLTFIASANAELVDMFADYVATPFALAAHCDRLELFWTRAIPNEAYPGVPSKQWDLLGFQGADPTTDFRGAGVCAMDALVYFTEFPDLFHALLASARRHAIPFATASIVLVNEIFEFLGIGFKSRGVPLGELPTTERNLSRLLYGHTLSGGDVALKKAFKFTKRVMYSLCLFGMLFLADAWMRRKAGYLDFPAVSADARTRFEGALRSINNQKDLEVAIKVAAMRVFSVDVRREYLKLAPEFTGAPLTGSSSTLSRVNSVTATNLAVLPVSPRHEIWDGKLDDASAPLTFPHFLPQNESALALVGKVAMRELPARREISPSLRREEKKWIGRLVKAQIQLLERLIERSHASNATLNWAELIARLFLHRRPREIDGHAWEIIDRLRAFCTMLGVKWRKESVQETLTAIALEFSSSEETL